MMNVISIKKKKKILVYMNPKNKFIKKKNIELTIFVYRIFLIFAGIYLHNHTLFQFLHCFRKKKSLNIIIMGTEKN